MIDKHSENLLKKVPKMPIPWDDEEKEALDAMIKMKVGAAVLFKTIPGKEFYKLHFAKNKRTEDSIVKARCKRLKGVL